MRRKRTPPSPATTPLFSGPLLDGALDAMQSDAHGPHLRLDVSEHSEPPVTPEPTPAERRDDGIKRSTEHANQEVPKWSDRADAYMTMMIGRRGYKPFLAEELVEASIRDGIPQPPDKRAWGGVFRRLANKGIIRKMGYQQAKTSNLSPKCLWGKV